MTMTARQGRRVVEEVDGWCWEMAVDCGGQGLARHAWVGIRCVPCIHSVGSLHCILLNIINSMIQYSKANLFFYMMKQSKLFYIYIYIFCKILF